MATDRLENIVGLSKRRGFVFPSSEIYGGLRASWDYGPLGVELKNNVKRQWWKSMVTGREDVVGLDSCVILAKEVWEASGHVATFSDPLTECTACHKRYRADHLEEAYEAKHKKAPASLADINCPACGNKGQFTEPKQFSGMLKTYLGPVEDESGLAFLRPETAQGIFINFDQVMTTSRKKPPFGIGQIGKSFRNEITPGNFIFRTREFEQMEMQFFIAPGTQQTWYEHWKEQRMKWHLSLGLGANNYRFHDHEKLAHYADAAADIEFKFPFGFKELEGIHSRTDFDLGSHEKFSGKKLQYFDHERNESYVPYVVETSVGVDRMFLAVFSNALCEEQLDNDTTRTVLRLPAVLAPTKAAILPLVKKDGLPEMAQEIVDQLKWEFAVAYDEKDAVGRRYRRQDALGTPFCITVDHQSLEDRTVTLRHRDSMEQTRVAIQDLSQLIGAEVNMQHWLQKIK